MTRSATDVVSQVLAPCSAQQFFDEYLGKKPLVVKGKGSRFNIAGEDPKGKILSDYKKYASTLTCHAHSPSGPPPHARPVNDASAFLGLVSEYHKLGYTVRIPDVTDLFANLTEFTRSLEKLVNNEVGVVVFWSAPGAAAPVHYDEVDVFVIQLQGTKRWFISNEPSTLPNKWKNAGEPASTLTNYQTLDVEPGDLIYLPRGTVHTVQSTSESLHLSIGFVPVTAREGVIAMADFLSEHSFSLRSGLFPSVDEQLDGDTFKQVANKIRKELAQLVTQCQSDDFIKAALARRRARMIAELPKLDKAPPQDISPDTRLKRHPLAMSEIVMTRDFVDFTLPGEHILINSSVEKAVRFIEQTPSFVVRDIPGDIGNDVRVALVNKFVGSGFLQVSE
ncbi:cupin domain-containing protein [Pseudoalteromonas sp. YIC-656]|uniref:JmjC domain-containing protein n=1 Tax=Pseudoalteromonas pernae TaxID=3118054 RepID=UPI003242C508